MKTSIVKMAAVTAVMCFSIGAGAQTQSDMSSQSTANGTMATDQGANSSQNNSTGMANKSTNKMKHSKSSGASGTRGCAGGTGNKSGASNSGNADGAVGGNPDCTSPSEQTKMNAAPNTNGKSKAGTANGSSNDPTNK